MKQNKAKLLGGWKVRGPFETKDGSLILGNSNDAPFVGVLDALGSGGWSKTRMAFTDYTDHSQYIFNDHTGLRNADWKETISIENHHRLLLKSIKQKGQNWPDEVCLSSSGITREDIPLFWLDNLRYGPTKEASVEPRSDASFYVFKCMEQLFRLVNNGIGVHDIFRVIHTTDDSVVLSSMRSWLDDWYLDMVMFKHMQSHYVEHDSDSRAIATDWRNVFLDSVDATPNTLTSAISVIETNNPHKKSNLILAISNSDVNHPAFQDLGLDLTEAGALFVLNKNIIQEHGKPDQDEISAGDIVFLHSDNGMNLNNSMIDSDMRPIMPIVKAIHGENGVYDIINLSNANVNWTWFHDHNFAGMGDGAFKNTMDMDSSPRIDCDEHFVFAREVCGLSFDMALKTSGSGRSSWVETWQDNRDPIIIDYTPPKAIYTGVIRCPTCNGRIELRIPEGHERKPIACGHCKKTSISISDLGIGEKVQTIFPPRTVRTNLFNQGDQ